MAIVRSNAFREQQAMMEAQMQAQKFHLEQERKLHEIQRLSGLNVLGGQPAKYKNAFRTNRWLQVISTMQPGDKLYMPHRDYDSIRGIRLHSDIVITESLERNCLELYRKDEFSNMKKSAAPVVKAKWSGPSNAIDKLQQDVNDWLGSTLRRLKNQGATI